MDRRNMVCGSTLMALLWVCVYGFLCLRRIRGMNKGNGVSGMHLIGTLLGVGLRRIGGTNKGNGVSGLMLGTGVCVCIISCS